ncbi:MAG: hypothetical protein JO181_07225 [Solirubrobacterales bacterium]|nr:hypothetical protein [Solirubrobacterales bacterium]
MDKTRLDNRDLTYRERRVLELRYGLDGAPPRTLAEVAQILDLSRESVRQLEHHALEVLGIRASPPMAAD